MMIRRMSQATIHPLNRFSAEFKADGRDAFPSLRTDYYNPQEWPRQVGT